MTRNSLKVQILYSKQYLMILRLMESSRDLIGAGPDARAMCHALDPWKMKRDKGFTQDFCNLTTTTVHNKSYTALE